MSTIFLHFLLKRTIKMTIKNMFLYAVFRLNKWFELRGHVKTRCYCYYVFMLLSMTNNRLKKETQTWRD